MPHRGTVEVDHHPLGRVERERRGVVNSVHEDAELGTDERGAGVRGVHVHPQAFLVACRQRTTPAQLPPTSSLPVSLCSPIWLTVFAWTADDAILLVRPPV